MSCDTQEKVDELDLELDTVEDAREGYMKRLDKYEKKMPLAS